MSATLPADLVARLLDDAAIFPPGDLPLSRALTAHLGHLHAAHADLVGPFVVGVADLGSVSDLTADLPEGSLDLAVTTPLERAGEAVARSDRIPAARLTIFEVSLPEGVEAAAVVAALDAAFDERPELSVFVEIPRDSRHDAVLRSLADTRYLAKLRTGGVRAGLHPDEVELAHSVLGAVTAGVPFKATAGLHHAIRNTDPVTGFEQHGFLNLLVATAIAIEGGTESEVAAVLADRDGARVAETVRTLSPRVREAFCSFGTCSVAEPVEELAALGLLPPTTSKDVL